MKALVHEGMRQFRLRGVAEPKGAPARRSSRWPRWGSAAPTSACSAKAWPRCRGRWCRAMSSVAGSITARSWWSTRWRPGAVPRSRPVRARRPSGSRGCSRWFSTRPAPRARAPMRWTARCSVALLGLHDDRLPASATVLIAGQAPPGRIKTAIAFSSW